MESIDLEPEHELQVRRLALILFDKLAPLHGLGERERAILEAGAMLHDIGMVISGKRHHKNSYEMIKNHRFSLWRPEEVDMIALVARYHRKAEPSMKHVPYAALPQSERSVIQKLAAIVRVADGLDRSHLSTVQNIDVEIDPRSITLKLHAYRDCSTEIWGAERKAGLFEKVFARRLNVQAVGGYRARKN